MNFTLSDLANIAAIVSVPLMLLTWLVTRERFAAFWKKRFKTSLLITVVFAAILGSWQIGWFSWLQYQITWPVWGLILYPIILLSIIAGIGFLILYIYDRLHPIAQQRDYYTIYGARWYFHGKNLIRPPVCANCLMEMINLSMPELFRTSEETWKCRQCGHEITWDSSQRGDLLADVTAHFNAGLRRALEKA